jgi:hypothetical protein
MENSKNIRRRTFSLVLACLLLPGTALLASGCSRGYVEETVQTKPSGPGDDPGGAAVPSGTIHTYGTPGPHSPVSGTESLQGAGGGGVGQAAKDRARATQPGSSLDQISPE